MSCAKTLMSLWIAAVGCGLSTSTVEAEERLSTLTSTLQQDFELGGKRSPGTYYFDMVTTFVEIRPDGKRGAKDTYRVKLKCVSQGDARTAGDHYTCKRFVYAGPDGAEASIPALAGWTYIFKKTATGCDDKGQVFGIDHSRFRQLKDGSGRSFASDKAYLIYNTFIDFHGFCDELAAPTAQGKGIQDLRRIGQRIVHEAANSKPPTSLGGHIKESSSFQNGEITLELKGLSVLDGQPCAVVEFDSGAASFEMLMEPVPGMRMKTVGGSHYFGDIHVDLASRWPRKVALREMIVSETKVPVPGNKGPKAIIGVQERQTLIRLVTKEAYEAD